MNHHADNQLVVRSTTGNSQVDCALGNGSGENNMAWPRDTVGTCDDKRCISGADVIFCQTAVCTDGKGGNCVVCVEWLS